MTKTALVTGGTSGIGLATVKKFLNEGFAVTALNFKDGGHTAELQALGDYTFKEGDVTDAKRVEEIIAQLVDGGPIRPARRGGQRGRDLG